MNEKGKMLRDTTLQLLATVMIPISVAGTGLYYTRWQQNLNDLKTMIDLVSDQNAERRKYGVAMFEYLLKNDKVPVEFVAAQLSYANSSADKELLPLMEQAMFKAAAANPKVSDTFREALERMPSRVFVHALDDRQRQCFSQLFAKIDFGLRTGIVVPGFARATWGGQGHELRIFRATDAERGNQLAKILGDVGLRVAVKDLSGSPQTDRNRPNSFELWLGKEPMPASCG
jgi:hypothetical protein